jgi:tellurite resistance protein
MDAPDDVAVNTEALKLLVQVASANDHIHDKERELLARLAKTWKVSHVLEALFAELDAKHPLSQPQLSILRPHADRILNAARALVAADGEIDADEDDMLTEVKALLGRS